MSTGRDSAEGPPLLRAWRRADDREHVLRVVRPGLIGLIGVPLGRSLVQVTLGGAIVASVGVALGSA